jgi:alpha-methylacyl-CoA racemase
MEGADACFTPVLDMQEAMEHPHNAARRTFIEVEGVRQPAPAPRFSRTAPEVRPRGTASTSAILGDFGFSAAEIAALASEAR